MSACSSHWRHRHEDGDARALTRRAVQRDGALVSPHDAENRRETQTAADEPGGEERLEGPVEDIGAHAAVAAALGGLCRKIALSVPLGGLVLTGGDIALSCCSLLSASGISVVREVAPGIPVGVLKGGQCPGMKVVTKAGAFGAEDALCRAVDSLKIYQETSA